VLSVTVVLVKRSQIQIRVAALLCLGSIAIGAFSASAASAESNPVLQECSSGTLSGTYSIGQLQQALGLLTAVEREYTSCQDVIQRALLAAIANGRSGRGRSSGGGSSAFLPTLVVIVLVALGLTAVALGSIAVRRRRGDHDR
jgi:hypothetical protein